MDAITDTNVYEPHQWKHSTIVAGVEWKNPVGTASGTFQLAACRWFYDVSQMGAICTKGVSPEPWQGNPGPRTAETPAGMVNSVGLQNPGVDHYLVDELPSSRTSEPRSSPMSPGTATTSTPKSWRNWPTRAPTCWRSTSAAPTSITAA